MITHRRFVLNRTSDVTGVSGTGVVAEGIEFANGVVALQWLSEFPTSVVFHQRGIESVQAVHGHNGATEIVWLDGPETIEERRVFSRHKWAEEFAHEQHSRGKSYRISTVPNVEHEDDDGEVYTYTDFVVEVLGSDA